MDNFTSSKIDLVLNHMTREKYNELLSTGQIMDNELYLVDQENLDALCATIVNVADPILSSDAANKHFVETSIDSLSIGNLSTSISKKLDQTVAAEEFSNLSTYGVDDYVTWNGQLYRFLSSHISSDWTGEDVVEISMTSPDTYMETDAYGALEIFDKNGAIVWKQGYNQSTISSNVLSNETVNYIQFATNSTEPVEIILPYVTEGKIGDFILDVSNPELIISDIVDPAFDSTATYAMGDEVVYDNEIWKCTVAVETPGDWTGDANWIQAWPEISLGSGFGTEFNVVVPKGESLSSWLRIEPGEMSEIYFTLTSFQIGGLPTYKIVKQIVVGGI